MDRYFTKTFVKFFFAFVLIIGIAFGVIMIVSSQEPQPIDNVAGQQ